MRAAASRERVPFPRTVSIAHVATFRQGTHGTRGEKETEKEKKKEPEGRNPKLREFRKQTSTQALHLPCLKKT